MGGADAAVTGDSAAGGRTGHGCVRYFCDQFNSLKAQFDELGVKRFKADLNGTEWKKYSTASCNISVIGFER